MREFLSAVGSLANSGALRHVAELENRAREMQKLYEDSGAARHIAQLEKETRQAQKLFEESGAARLIAESTAARPVDSERRVRELERQNAVQKRRILVLETRIESEERRTVVLSLEVEALTAQLERERHPVPRQPPPAGGWSLQ